jgi:hypothetical protein
VYNLTFDNHFGKEGVLRLPKFVDLTPNVPRLHSAESGQETITRKQNNTDFSTIQIGYSEQNTMFDVAQIEERDKR